MIVDGLRRFYNAAAAENPDVYQAYPFESWLGYMTGWAIIRQDGNVVQLTVRGKDFLKYLVLAGRSEKQRRY